MNFAMIAPSLTISWEDDHSGIVGGRRRRGTNERNGTEERTSRGSD